MYKRLWNHLNAEHVKNAHRPAVFLVLLTAGWSVIGVLAGLLVCLGLQTELMVKLTVILCTGGYAGLLLGFFGGIFYLYRLDLRRRFVERSADEEKASVDSLIYLTNSNKAV